MLLERVAAVLDFQGLGLCSRSVQPVCHALGQSFYVYISLYIKKIPMGTFRDYDCFIEESREPIHSFIQQILNECLRVPVPQRHT